MEFNVHDIVRENIRTMKPYSTARHEFKGQASIYLDANENNFGSPVQQTLNRYPDPLQPDLKDKINAIKGVPAENIFLGNGSDEAIDILIRIFCEPGRDNIILLPPTYGMYEVCANTNNVRMKKVTLTEDFQPDLAAIAEAIDPFTKLIFLCSPNNPSGNSMNREAVYLLLNNFDGLVIIDEAYINYSRQKSFINELVDYPNLVILQTFSKAWGLAGLRLGMAFASREIIGYMNKIKYPYNISDATKTIAMEALNHLEQVNAWTRSTVEQRDALATELKKLDVVQRIYPSDANFLLVKMKEARKIYEYLAKEKIVVRDRSDVILCEDCLRITVGTPGENQILLDSLKNYSIS